MKVIHLIAAARPNFMKIAPLWHELANRKAHETVLIHTGQHRDENMSGAFFRELELPDPDIHLGVGGGTHAELTAEVMVKYEKVCLERRPDLVVVVGDVNSTMACAITAKKLNLPVAHLEAGLRSRNMGMPEEINRVITDRIADVLWTPSADADENLRKEGVHVSAIRLVGNIMIDSYQLLRSRIEKAASERRSSDSRPFCVATFHRPSNVDDKPTLLRILRTLDEISTSEKVCFPVHPRTRKKLEEFGLIEGLLANTRIVVLPPMSYVEFMSLVVDACFVITDSGGVQEETSYLGIPCFTLREETERPITVSQGSNTLVNPANALAAIAQSRLENFKRVAAEIPLWDGKTASRIADDMDRFFDRSRA